jgi:hypothetical protein
MVIGYYKVELVRGPTRTGPWRTVEDVELATLGWVHWHNTSRLHSYLDDIPPSEFETEVLRYETDRPCHGRNPIARVSIRPTHQHLPVEGVEVEGVTGDRAGRLFVGAHTLLVAAGDAHQIGELLKRLGRAHPAPPFSEVNQVSESTHGVSARQQPKDLAVGTFGHGRGGPLAQDASPVASVASKLMRRRSFRLVVNEARHR